jgi:hypothetical protein
MRFLRAALVPLACLLLVASGIGALLWYSDTAREVTFDSLKTIFTIVTTPFILETIVASIFLLGLLAYNRWRLHKDGDGWVYLVTRETAGAGNAARQMHSVILTEKPELAHEDEDEAGVIEGYLELGMAAQALEELNRADSGTVATLETTILRVRVLAANLDTGAAQALFHETAWPSPRSRPRPGCGRICPRFPMKPGFGKTRRPN